MVAAGLFTVGYPVGGRPNGKPKHRISAFSLWIVKERIGVEIERERRYITVGDIRFATRTHAEATRRAVERSPARNIVLAKVTGKGESTIRRWKNVYTNERSDWVLVEAREAAKKAEGAWPGGVYTIRKQIHPEPLARYYDHELKADDDAYWRQQKLTVLERLANIEAKLDENLRLTVDIAQRLQAKFPTDAEVSEAVEVFVRRATA